MRKKDIVKEQGDQLLVDLIEKLQAEIALESDLDQTTMDLSDDNIAASKILQAKYSFLYKEARHRNTRFSGFTNAISQ
ncbi:YaaL family protein [Lactobacillus sp. ESL0791]|uniref:YaaL family protein n=1 Tax=Lactobacillus sp. ESL0791 TaxID=2983234 RepID=UPI0023F88E4F|nr:YaaL family protein [Lactobacillus sp. ESL0791]MDF7638391.1 YaaL family protein [Lactobacillus sp. ESL0791]